MIMDDIGYYWRIHRGEFLLFLAAFILARVIYYLYLGLTWRRKR
jgi:hypothetical protein